MQAQPSHYTASPVRFPIIYGRVSNKHTTVRALLGNTNELLFAVLYIAIHFLNYNHFFNVETFELSYTVDIIVQNV